MQSKDLSKELRIGNFILNELPFGGNEIVEIKSYDFGTGKMTRAKGVPINELEKEFGLRFDDKGFIEISNKCVVDTRSLTVNIFIEFLDHDIDLKLPDFIHEFQNLYFALTGEELELKNKSKP